MHNLACQPLIHCHSSVYSTTRLIKIEFLGNSPLMCCTVQKSSHRLVGTTAKRPTCYICNAARTWQHNICSIQDKLADRGMHHQRRTASLRASHAWLAWRRCRRHRQRLQPPHGVDGREECVPPVGIEKQRCLGGNVEIDQGTSRQLDDLDAVLVC